MSAIRVPLVSPVVGDEEIRAVTGVIRSGQLASGPEVRAFEAEVCAATGAPFAVAVNSGTAAVHAGLEAMGVGDGDEVIVTPFTFAASATPILMQRAVPRFLDIDARSFNLEPAVVAANLATRTKATVLVDLFGLPVDPAGIEALRARGVGVFEDACQSIGAVRAGRGAGTLGDASSLSFYATKNVMTGEGGMLLTGVESIANAARRFRHHGQGDQYEYLTLGYNYRMTDLCAAIGRVQLGRMPGLTAARRANAAFYDAALAGIEGLTLPAVPAGVEHAYHQYSVLVDADRTPSGIDRDGVRAFLAEREIATGIYYPKPLHLHPLFAAYGYGPGDFPIAERVAKQIVALPIHPGLSREQLEHVARSFTLALRAKAA